MSTRTSTSRNRSWRVPVNTPAVGGRSPGARQPGRPGGGRAAAIPVASARRILGIDPGTLRLGYGVVEMFGPTDIRYVECGLITAPARMPRAERLVEIARGLRDLVSELKPGAVAMEEAFFGKYVQSTLALGEARGVALLVVGEALLTVAGYPPATVKKNVVGHGRATKDQIANLVRAALGLRRVPY